MQIDLDQRRLAAGVSLVAAMRSIEDRGSNLVGELLSSAPFVAFEHYPSEDVFDPATGAQYYFHAHAPEEHRQGGADWAEIGHIHTFVRPEGRRDDAPIHHLIAIALDRFGRPTHLFTTNRWVTGDDFIAARQAMGFAKTYHLTDQAPASRCISALFTLFADDIASLLIERDAAIHAWQRAHPDGEALEDRALEITSSRTIDLVAVLSELQSMID
ncbi:MULTISPECIES: DUF6969 family protein [Acidiphilium]|jgi:hypothetical protein|uniref:DUF6969 domain-containing protein n=1 Tax=Acidiphilium rubrum TaxID=526 RepID=A0A8G2CP39_ACIRU|nr:MULTISPECIES: hypothetical protein [Acidiphilium]MCW8309500.1 hypothetical protein [Acidiphilium sp. PA]SIR55404.1 hypothetical protein SAMN05421828_1536 [Acidiphilium rubrum]HQT89648.1 hypothetical protein [Acidiphilium sp.]